MLGEIRLLQFRSASSRVMLMLLGLTVAASAALGILTWRLTVLDRAVEEQRATELLQQAVDFGSTALLQEINHIGDRLQGILEMSGAGRQQAIQLLARESSQSTVVFANQEELQLTPSRPLRYLPNAPRGPAVPDETFAEGETLEYGRRDYLGASQYFRNLAKHSRGALEAGALLRAARNDVKRNERSLALATYSELQRLGPEIVDDEPVDLTARFARLDLLPDPMRRVEASTLARELEAGHWRISRATYEYYRGALERSSHLSRPMPLWENAVESIVTTSRKPGLENGELVIWTEPSEAMLLVWRSRATSLVALAITGKGIADGWLAGRPGISFGLETADHRSLVSINKSRKYAERIFSLAGAHWRFMATATGIQVERRGSGTLLLSLLLVTVLVLAGSLAVIKAVARELSVAQLQTDFVSAVSHDFRTPLTTLRSMSEMLERNRVPTEERKQRYYELMAQETTRLQRLIEDLLDFGRIDAGVRRYNFRPCNLAELVHQTTLEFQDEHAASGILIETGDLPSLLVSVDGEAFRRALYNLVDNAVKYSPERGAIRLDVCSVSNRVYVSVEDHGMGIAPHELKRIFRKFERGTAAKSSSIRGTGLGLAMVHSIMKAHGGFVQVQSELHRGSKFTLILPCAVKQEQEIACQAS